MDAGLPDHGYSHTNRLRDTEIVRLFGQYGFSLIKARTHQDMLVNDEIRNSFIDPFRSMPNQELGLLGRCYCFRKAVR